MSMHLPLPVLDINRKWSFRKTGYLEGIARPPLRFAESRSGQGTRFENRVKWWGLERAKMDARQRIQSGMPVPVRSHRLNIQEPNASQASTSSAQQCRWEPSPISGPKIIVTTHHHAPASVRTL